MTYDYDNSGALATVYDSETGISTTYYYDFTDRMMKYVEEGTGYSHSVGYEYDTINNLTAMVETINGVKHTTGYTYDKDNRVTAITTDGISESYTYDAYGRVSTKVTKSGSATVLTETYTYVTNSAGQPTGQVATHRTRGTGYDVTYSYTYDGNGNILSVSDGTYTTTYQYDSANQLIRENNQQAGKTWTWSYDNAGNIQEESVFPYTIGELDSSDYDYEYIYGDSQWGDLLTSYDKSSYVYDTLGNLTDDGNVTYEWQHGRQLLSIDDGGIIYEMSYNANGMRTGLVRYDVETNQVYSTYTYVYNGSQLVQMTVDGNTLYFTYDASGSPQTVKYNGTTYYYVTNLQGDVIAILNSSGDTVVSYSYDAWGGHTSGPYGTGALSSTLGKHNPLHYRGYVYNSETALYYLQSRYYDPFYHRFISADAYASTGQGVLGNNMFAYCGNNPVSRKDEGGEFWEIVVGAAIGGAIAGAIIGTVSHLVSCGINGTDVTVSGLLEAAATGAVTGAIGAVGGAIGGVAAVVASVGVGSISGVVTAINNEGSTSEKIAAGLTAGVVSGFGTYLGTKIPVATDSAFTTGFTSFAGGLFMGAQTEIVNVTTQQIVSNSFNKKSSRRKSINWNNYLSSLHDPMRRMEKAF